MGSDRPIGRAAKGRRFAELPAEAQFSRRILPQPLPNCYWCMVNYRSYPLAHPGEGLHVPRSFPILSLADSTSQNEFLCTILAESLLEIDIV